MNLATDATLSYRWQKECPVGNGNTVANDTTVELQEFPVKPQTTKVKKKVKMLVGICSTRAYTFRRAAVRETWLSLPAEGVHSIFFHGRTNSLTENPVDTVELDVRDDYEYLPAKVLAFFEHVLEHYEFEWLFKCDDDTYVAQDRLLSLAKDGVDLVGDPMLDVRRAPSGGAGYLLSRNIVEKIVSTPNFPRTGAEDWIVGRMVTTRFHASWVSTKNLCYDCSRMPRQENAVVSAHWCSPQKLKSIHIVYTNKPRIVCEGVHKDWRDKVLFFENGLFARKTSGCTGRWVRDKTGRLTLHWHEWPVEVLQQKGMEYDGEHFTLKPVSGNFPKLFPKKKISVPKKSDANAVLNAKAVLLFRFHSHFSVCRERLRILRHFNPDLPVYALYGGTLQEAGIARQSTDEFTLGFWNCSELCDAKTKWLRSDFLVKEWYSRVGRALNFSFLYLYEWDILTVAPLKKIFPPLVSSSVYVSPLRAFTPEEEVTWFWTKDRKWKNSEFVNYLIANYGIERPRHVSHAPGMVFSREFLEAQKNLPFLSGVNDGFAIPALAEAFGFPLRETKLFSHPRNSERRLWNTTGVAINDIKNELMAKDGMRTFHPVKAMVTLGDLLDLGLRNF
jgi:hypothetical protein